MFFEKKVGLRVKIVGVTILGRPMVYLNIGIMVTSVDIKPAILGTSRLGL